MLRVFKVSVTRRGSRVKSDCYYGKVKRAPGKWSSKIKLYVDKTASERKLKELQIAADQRASGVRTTELDRLGLPLVELVELYCDSLERQGNDADHVRITRWMLTRIIALTGWSAFHDLSTPAVERITADLTKMNGKPATVSYKNKFISRLKALVNWLLPAGHHNPLEKLRRISEKNAERTRDRRVATESELRALFALEMPESRRRGYALAAFNGLRRSEIAKQTTLFRLDAELPHIGIARKNDTTGKLDYVPFHTYVLHLFGDAVATHGSSLIARAPDMETMAKDLLRAGIAKVTDDPEKGIKLNDGRRIDIADDRGLRLDFHALRHTFITNAGEAHASRATKKKLGRHANEDITDGYSHAELVEMRTVMLRIPSPLDWTAPAPDRPAVATLTASAKARKIQDHRQDQGVVLPIPAVSRRVEGAAHGRRAEILGNSSVKPSSVAPCLAASSSDLPEMLNPDILSISRPSTQVD